ncbi:rolling circle replication-associated protein [Anaerotignum sp. MSJ-24]|uniref:rolling circle replication-associated protein n=1 Tax=Anaerotignum sp. MSJ-24 TaxID=2841521 RepID=UPI001C0F7F0F|nr:hypothetical protein [Anaerotignum sp. MSJ-24]MBU5464957.1 hypothetical protein [Anaerotignum sp. MSJ-24]
MPKYRKKIWAGDIYEVEEFYSPRTIGKKYERLLRGNLTTEEQQKRNLEIARKKLTRTINANFGAADYFLTLTYDGAIEAADAKKKIANFFRRLKRWRLKNGQGDLKYISVLETKGRCHHHVILNGLMGLSLKEAWEILFDLWGEGYIFLKRLKKSQEDTRLASYITKENIKKNAKRWSQSRNLQKPKVKIEEVAEHKTHRPLTVPKNYIRLLYTENYFSEIGWVRYLKAIREGGEDYGEYIQRE